MTIPIRWSKGAKGCYEIGCNCSVCQIVPPWFKKKCKMKKSVKILLDVIGKPLKKDHTIYENKNNNKKI